LSTENDMKNGKKEYEIWRWNRFKQITQNSAILRHGMPGRTWHRKTTEKQKKGIKRTRRKKEVTFGWREHEHGYERNYLVLRYSEQW